MRFSETRLYADGTRVEDLPVWADNVLRHSDYNMDYSICPALPVRITTNVLLPSAASCIVGITLTHLLT